MGFSFWVQADGLEKIGKDEAKQASFEHSVCFLNVKYVSVDGPVWGNVYSVSDAINIEGLSHYFGNQQVLKDVSFSVAQGRQRALLGPNGAGKTTLFSILTCLLRVAEGQATVFGNDVARASGKALARIGVVFQKPTLDLDLSVSQNLAYHGAIQGMNPRRVRDRAEQELKRLQLWERRDDPVRNLNGGHRRRVEIARALLHEPDLLLLDEATAGLDLASRVSLQAYIRSLVQEQGLAVLWTTHLVEELQADEDVVLLKDGAVQAQGRLTDLVRAAGVGDAKDLLLGLSTPAGNL
jgi:ABC-2 type transport system ATP-binding protein